MSQQYVKNTNKPDPDSYLWNLGNNWRISAKTGDVYCPLKYDENDEIKNLELFTSMIAVLKKPITELDYATIAGYYFLPTKTQDGDPLLWAFTDEAAVKKKLENTKKYAGNSSTGQPLSTTVPKSQSPSSSPQTQLNTTVSTTPVNTRTVSVNSANKSMEEVTDSVLLRQNEILTYTDPQWIQGGSDIARELEKQGYNYIPRSLSEHTSRIEDVHDVDEQGNQITVGEQHLFLMGRIINVKVGDN